MDTKATYWFLLMIEGALSALTFTETELRILSGLSNHLNSKSLAFAQEPSIYTIKLLSQMKFFSYLTSFEKTQDLKKEEFAKTLLIKKKIQGLDFYLKAAKKDSSFSRQLLVFDDDLRTAKDYEKIAVPFGFRLYLIRNFESNVSIFEKLDSERTRRIPVEVTSELVNGLRISVKENHNFQRAALTLALVSETPCRKMEEQHVFQKIRCYHKEIFDLMAARLNFTKEVRECRDKANPYVFPNGSYSGLFKMLLDRDADASSGSFVVSTKRLADFDFVWPTFVLKTMMYVKRETRIEDGHWASYLKPFEMELWLTIAAYISVSTAAVFYSRRFNREIRSTDAFDAFLAAFRIFCYQARFETSDARLAKIFQLVTSFAVTVLFTAYSGAIVSSLTVHRPVLPFLDLDGFFVSGKYKMTAIADSFIPYYFKEEYFSKKKISEKDFFLEFEKLPRDDREGIDGICDGITAYVGIRENVFGLEHSKCSPIEIPSPIFFQYLAIGVPQNSPFREDLNRELSYFRTSGILKKMESKLGRLTQKGRAEDRDVVFSVEIPQIVSALVVLLLGWCIGWILLFAEIKLRKVCLRSLLRLLRTSLVMDTQQHTSVTCHRRPDYPFNHSTENFFLN